MRKLIQGIVDFRKNLTEEKRVLFAQLALEQKPKTLFIACSDSRVVPNLFASTNPGDLFVLRNIGNIIPAHHGPLFDVSASSILEFSVLTLHVRDIIVCGHSECGAMKALAYGLEGHTCSHLKSWLKAGKDSLEKINQGFVIDPSLAKHNQLSQINVIQQMEHIKTYPFVKERWEKGEVRIHGWWYDIGQSSVYYYEERINQFVLIDGEEAKMLLEKFP